MDSKITDNITGRSHSLEALYQPKGVDEVIELVKAARRSGIALYPVSTGLNFG